MRILADIATHKILQVQSTPDIGESSIINGKYVIDIPEGSYVEVNSSSYVLNGGVVDSGSVVSLAFANLLANYPMYDNILFNPLLLASDVNDIDLTAFIPGSTNFSTRAQVGRGSVDPQEGLVANSTALLPVNTKASPNKPGVLITDTIDIGPFTGGIGAREFMVYWKLYTFSTSEDVTSSYGLTSGLNEPSIKSIIEVDQEPAGFEVLISQDDGTTYFPIGRLEPLAFCDPNTSIRIAFKNSTSQKLYLANYAIMF